MTKELTPLEHLEFIRMFEIDDEHRTINMHYACKQSLDIIETELKNCEMEHTLRIRLENINYELVREKQENEKKLKALEIIKNKRVNVHLLLLSDKLEQYNFKILPHRKLTQEEYDLLKEVLL